MLKNEQAQDGFYLDQTKALQVGKKIRVIEDKLGLISNFERRFADIDANISLLDEVGSDASLESELESSLLTLSTDIEKARVDTLLKGKYDNYDCIITLHAGAGGTDDSFWYILQQKDGTLYLAAGWHDPEANTDPASDDSYFYWIAKLSPSRNPQ